MPPGTCSLQNMQTNDIFQPQGNPTEFSYKIIVAYIRLKVGGLSHQVKQYSHTEDVKTPPIQFEFFGETLQDRQEMERKRHLFESWCYAARSTDIRGGAPPRVLFLWPNVCSFTCVITDYNVKLKEFSEEDGFPNWMQLELSIEQISDERILPELVKVAGVI